MYQVDLAMWSVGAAKLGTILSNVWNYLKCYEVLENAKGSLVYECFVILPYTFK